MTNLEAENLLFALNTMLDVKGICAFKIVRNKRMLEDELKDYFDFKEKIFRKYGEEVDGQLRVDKDSPKFAEFSAEFEELQKQNVDFNFRKITENELIDSGLTAKQMSMIWEWMVEENETV